MTSAEIAELYNAVRTIERLVPDSRGGLPDSLFFLMSRLTPMVNVELLIGNDKNEKLVTWRADRFYGPGWHLPGGIIRFKETAHQRMLKVAHLELHACVEFEPLPILVDEVMNPERDVRGHFISMVFKCRLIGELDPKRRADSVSTAENGQWTWVSSMPKNMIKQQLRFESLFNE